MINKYTIIIFLVIIGFSTLLYYSHKLYREYRSDALTGLERTKNLDNSLLLDKDIAHLPEPVQKYLRYVGVVGKPKVFNLKAVIDGNMKMDDKKEWFDVQVEQYSFFDKLTRLFFIRANMSGIPISGLHSYQDAKAIMLIKLAGLIPVVDGKGREMNQGETVTVLNDMCILAPATLIDPKIQWEPIDTLSAKAIFTDQEITVSARLYFNEKGQLINFVSDDRFYSPTGRTFDKVRWSTPVSDYKNINGFNLPTYGEAIWNFPDGDMSYARFNIRKIEYNCKTLQ